MNTDIQNYSKDALVSISDSNFLSEEDWKELSNMGEELQETFATKQMWRTETEMRCSVLNDIKHPTNASKYWQSKREQSVFFENLVTLSFDYRRNNTEIKRIERKIKAEKDDLALEDLKIDLEEAMFKKKNMELASKDRMRELKLWSKIKKELSDGSFNTKNVNEHQLDSYLKSYMIQAQSAISGGVKMSNSEKANLFGQLASQLRQAEIEGKLEEILKDIPEAVKETVMPQLGFQKNNLLK
ncbi:MAG: hypothetical protein DRP08_05325 [Candidatus Aenigmatarchaeota archaeon]|nr:MAG: hypothetical protein DRP08_05325 [Candidatus Aenigmarchaeota archaeon]